MGRNGSRSGQLAFLCMLYHRLSEYGVTVTDLKTIGSQDICRSSHLAVACNKSTTLMFTDIVL